VRETVRQNLNLTAAAEALFTSQPGVSKQIRELEDELGVQIFERHGKRFIGLTAPGRAVVSAIERVLKETENLKRTAQEFTDEKSGTLTIATTHTQARYALPKAVREFKRRYANVRLTIVQSSPPQIAKMVLEGQADIAIATETINNAEGLIAFPCYRWHHVVVVPPKHALLNEKKLSLKTLASHPLITYDSAFTGRGSINQAFAAQDLKPDIVLEAIDSDVIKTYVELGLGVGLLAGIAFDETRDKHLRGIDAAHLFPEKTTHLAVRKGAFLRGFAQEFIELFAPSVTKKTLGQALLAD
jgi:LysR family transcriptional regulator, cys regulon transcriptional activator